MGSKQRVRKAVLFEGPDRVPLGVMPEGYPSDIRGVGAGQDPGWTPSVRTETRWEDEFGCIWAKLEGDVTMGQVTGHPLSDYAMMDDIRWPDYRNQARYEGARERIESNADDKFILASVPLSLIHRLEYMRGHQAAWTDPYEHPEELRRLLDRLADIAIDAIDNFAEIGAHGIISADDWGLQDRPMVSPKVFKEFWAPAYRRIYHHAHERGLLNFLHSCGHIADLLEDFIGSGLNVIQMDQQENMGMEMLAERFGGRLCFWCPVDIQQTMARGSLDDIRAYARRLIECFGRFNGGFIAQWYASPRAVGHAEDKIKAMCDEFVSYGAEFYNRTH